MRRKNRIGIPGLCCLLLALALSACGPEKPAEESLPVETTAAETPAPEDMVYLSMATSGNWSDILRGDLWNEYCEKLKEWSGGRMVMQGYFGGSLGNDLELIEGISEGTLCLINMVPSYQISVVPEAALLDTPGVFSSPEEYNYFIDNYYMDTLQSYYHRKGLRLLISSAFDFRVLTSNKPVRSMEDLKDLKLRTMETKYHVAFWQAMGASVLSMNFNQMRLAIQQGLLQAQENPMGYMVSSRLSDVQNQVIRTRHVLMISNFLMNEKQYEALAAEDRDLLQRFLEEMSRDLVEKQPMEDADLSETLTAQGIEIYDASEDIREAIETVGQPVVLDMLRKDLGDDVVDDFLEKVQRAKAAFPGEG